MIRFIVCTMVLLTAMMALGGCKKATRAAPILTAGYELKDNKPVRDVNRGLYTDSLAGYRRVLIEAVTIYPDPGVRLQPDVAIRLSEQFRRELVSRFANDLEVVQLPGAHTLRVQANVIGVQPSIAYGMASADMEALVTDSVTGEAKLALRDNRRLIKTFQPSAVSQWENARMITQEWGRLIGEQTLNLLPAAR